MELEELKKEFIKLYGEGEVISFLSPGRINLIGEHIDYNGGYVFPCATDFGTYACARKRNDGKINLASTNFQLKVSVEARNIEFKKEDEWANYPKGVIKIMLDSGYKINGMDLLISGNIPNGAGLSSSASLEVLIGVIVNHLFNEDNIDRIELVKIAQKAENNFVGVNCGIMDQFAVGMGKKNKAMLLNCDNLECQYSDVNLLDNSIVVMNTNKRRALNESKYNERRSECEDALNILKQKKKINNICEIKPSEFKELENLFVDERVKNRAEHCVYENARVLKAFECLNKGEIKEFGKLLTESHNSLRDLYEVTGKELDIIVEEALLVDGCLGARMTGAGFGGCAIALVKNDKIEEFINKVRENYNKKVGYDPSFYCTGIGEGTHQISYKWIFMLNQKN